MTNKTLYERLYDYSLRLLSFRPRSESEIKRRLKTKAAKLKAPTEIVDKIILSLKEQDLINDQEFAHWWISQRQTFKPKGKMALFLELKQKGLEREIIDKVLGELGNDWQEQSCLLLTSKWLQKHQYAKGLETKEKLFRFLASRGFDFETIQKVIDTLTKKG